MDNPVRIRFEGDSEEGARHLKQARAYLDRYVSTLGEGVTTGGGQCRLSDNAYCYFRVHNGEKILHIVATPGVSTNVVETVSYRVPDFMSGMALTARIEDQNGTKVFNSLVPTERTSVQFNLGNAGRVKTKKLAVKVYDPIKPNNRTLSFEVAQQYYIVPSMYSGTMRKVVQAVMGFGNIDDKKRNQYEKLSGKLDKREFPAFESSYHNECVSKGVQVRYDYRFPRTHGIHKAQDGKLWLVEIGLSRGVIAMPLPLWPITDKPDFKAALEDIGDDDGLRMIEEFGGFPSGESFPSGPAFAAMKRAGYIIDLSVDMSEFYAHTAYSQDIGWAFSYSGKEAHNTAWKYGDDGVQRGVHYALSLNIGNIEKESTENQGRKAILRERIRRFQEGNAGEYDAAILKIGRMTSSQLDRCLSAGDSEAIWNAVNSLQMSPIAIGTGSLSKVSEGILFNPGYTPTTQIKFPFRMKGYCASHVWYPEIGGPNRSYSGRSDTTMFVFFDGEELKWLKYFFDPRERPHSEVEDGFEPCMYVGRWERTEQWGMKSCARSFYCNDIDMREETVSHEIKTTVEGQRIGYSSAYLADWPVDVRYGSLFRKMRFKIKTTTEAKHGPSSSVCAMVSLNDRECFFISHSKAYESHTISTGYGYQYVTDPNSASYFRALWGGDQAENCAKPKNLRRITALGYSPGGCSDVADNGEWVRECDIAEYKVFNIPEPGLPAGTVQDMSGNSLLRVWAVMSGVGAVLVDSQTNPSEATAVLWSKISPDEFGFTEVINSIRNCLGDREIAIAMKQPNSSILEAKIVGDQQYVYPYLKDLICFVGVV